MKQFVFAFAVLLSFAPFANSVWGAEKERYENVVLFNVEGSDKGSVVRFDGFRRAPIDAEVVLSDSINCGIDSFEKLSKALGVAPNLNAAKIGDAVGWELGDALTATVEVTDGTVTAIDVIKSDTRPLVGIAWAGSDLPTKSQKVIAESILSNGGRAVFLPKVATEAECDEAMGKLDAFFMPGGADVNPKLFGEEPYPHGSVGCDDARDVSDLLTTRWAISHNIPALWVCRGEQMLNVALGGALIQDVPTHLGAQTLDGKFSFEQVKVLIDEGAPSTYGGKPDHKCMPRHFRVSVLGINHQQGRHALGTEDRPGISEDSKFLDPIINKRFCESIHTSHHQSADPERIGEGLSIAAFSQDGIVEALEYQKNDFALGTQFHIEYDAISQDNPEIASFGNLFFKALIKHAQKR